MAYDYDIIVAGGGIAGSLAAAAAAKKGAKVLMLDRNDRINVGKKTNWGWVCGDAVAKVHIDFIKEHLGMALDYPELDLKVDGVYVLSPDMKNKMLFEGAGFSLDRPKIERKFAQFAIKAGVDYKPEHEVEGPILEGETLTGVWGKDQDKKDFKYTGKIIIDALGMASTLRRKLPINEYVERDVSIDDIESTGRYIYTVDELSEDERYYDKKNALIHLNQQLAPGGYGWVFPKTQNRVNIGIGVERKSLDIRNTRLSKKDSLHKLIDEYVAWNPVIKPKEVDNTDNNGKGYWSVAVRRQQDSLVWNNYMGAGDSMAMPNPISAGGIGPAMTSGILAGEVAGDAIKENKVTMDYLWKYNVRYNDAYGSKTAGLEVFRIYLQSLDNELINYGMANFLTKEEAVQISYGLIPEMTMSGTLMKIMKGVQNINAFNNLRYCVSTMKRLNGLYANYPKDTKGFKAFKAAVSAEIKDAKARFPPMPIRA